jgi:hypothetical protein
MEMVEATLVDQGAEHVVDRVHDLDSRVNPRFYELRVDAADGFRATHRNGRGLEIGLRGGQAARPPWRVRASPR